MDKVQYSSKRLLTQFHEINALDYKSVWDFQSILHNRIKSSKRNINNNKNKLSTLNHIVFCEHLPVYTMGKSASMSNLLVSSEDLASDNIELFKINRGGDITFHGPGQITGYLIMDLELLYRDVHRYVRTLEEIIIKLLDYFGIEGCRVDDYTGVWVKENNQFKKICAIGVHLSRWVTMHGFALNVNTDTSYFGNIIPCGIDDKDKTITSLDKLLNKEVTLEIVKPILLDLIAEAFSLDIINIKG